MPRSDQLRIGRFSEHERIYLLTTTVEKREPIFANWRVGRVLVDELRSAHDYGLVESLAWVVMPDHVHWLLVLQRGSLSTLMRRVKGRSARRINSALKCGGRVWQDGYHDRALRREEDILSPARYLVANPLRAGLVARVGDYPLWDAVWV